MYEPMSLLSSVLFTMLMLVYELLWCVFIACASSILQDIALEFSYPRLHIRQTWTPDEISMSLGTTLNMSAPHEYLAVATKNADASWRVDPSNVPRVVCKKKI